MDDLHLTTGRKIQGILVAALGILVYPGLVAWVVYRCPDMFHGGWAVWLSAICVLAVYNLFWSVLILMDLRKHW